MSTTATIEVEIELPDGYELDAAWYVTVHLEGKRLPLDEVRDVRAEPLATSPPATPEGTDTPSPVGGEEGT